MLRDTAKYTTGKIASPITRATPAGEKSSGPRCQPASCCRKPRGCSAMVQDSAAIYGGSRKGMRNSRSHSRASGRRKYSRAARPADADGGADRRHGQAQLQRAADQRQRAGLRQHRAPRAEGIAQRAFGQSRKHGLQDHEGHGQRDEHAQGGHGGGRQDEYALHDCSVVIARVPHPHSMQGSTELRHPTMPLKRGGAELVLPGRSRASGEARSASGHNTYWPKMRAKRARTSARDALDAPWASGSNAKSLNKGRLAATSWRAGISQASATARWPSSDKT